MENEKLSISYLKNKAHIKKYQETHKEQIREYQNKYYHNNPSKRKESNKKYYETHVDHCREYLKNYNKNKYQNDESYRQYMNQKARNRYYAKVNPFIAESNRLLNILL
jgi:hypothetical protein